MAVHKLCREADRVAGDGLLTALIKLSGRGGGVVHFEFQLGEEAVPEGVQLVHIESHRDAQLAADTLDRLVAVYEL